MKKGEPATAHGVIPSQARNLVDFSEGGAEGGFNPQKYNALITAISSFRAGARSGIVLPGELALLWQDINLIANRGLLAASLRYEEHIDKTLVALHNLQHVAKSPVSLSTHSGIKMDIGKFVTDFVDDNLSDIEKVAVNADNPDRLQLAIRLVNTDTSNTARRDTLRKAFKRGIEIDKPKHLEDTFYKDVAADIIMADAAEGRFDWLPTISELVMSSGTHFLGKVIVDYIFQRSRLYPGVGDEVSKQMEQQIIEPLIKHNRMHRVSDFGLSFDDLYDGWRQDKGILYKNHRGKQWVYFEPHILFMEALEAERSGICQVLRERFGIKHFNRYPKEVLLHMYDTRDDKDTPYGTMMYSQFDNVNDRAVSGAFTNQKHLTQNFYDQLKGLGINLRIFEFGQEGTDSIFTTIDQYYPQPLLFNVFCIHGSPKSMSSGEKTKFSKRYFENGSAREIRRFFDDDATIIYFSCSTGADEGIGQATHNALGLDVIAPTVDTYISNIKVSRNAEGKLEFDVTYGDKDSLRKFSKK